MHSRLTEEQMRARFERGSLTYRGYEIVAKRDYSDLLAFDRGFYLRDGTEAARQSALAKLAAA